MVLSKVFIHLVFQGSSEDECQSMEASHNSVAIVNDDETTCTSDRCTNTSLSSNPTPNTTSPLVVAIAAVREGQEPSASPPPTLGRSHAPDGSKGQFSREQCGGEPADKQHGERQRESVMQYSPACTMYITVLALLTFSSRVFFDVGSLKL